MKHLSRLYQGGDVISIEFNEGISEARYIITENENKFNLLYIGNAKYVFDPSETLEELDEKIAEKFNPINVGRIGTLMEAIEDGLDHCTGYRYLAEKLSKDILDKIDSHMK
ncbi:MAG: hypothetical protein Q8936_23390 [Bacillota bacterium]|nr:hypothetical protein [Bacillota bacterium]